MLSGLYMVAIIDTWTIIDTGNLELPDIYIERELFSCFNF